MAISYVGGAAAAGATVALPAGVQAGDLLLVFAYTGSSAIAPDVAAGFTNINTGAGNTNGHRFGYKLATGPNDTVGTWTNAENVGVQVYRGVNQSTPIGGQAQMTQIAALTYPAVTMAATDGTSWIAGFIGVRTTAENAYLPPSGMVNRIDVGGLTGTTSEELSGHDTNGGVTSWSAQTGGNSTTGSRYRSVTAEIRAAAATAASSSGSAAIALGTLKGSAEAKALVQASAARTLGAASTISAAKLLDAGRLGGALGSLTLKATVAPGDPREVTVSSGIALIVDQGRFDTQGKTTSPNFWVTPEYGKGYMQTAHGGGNHLQVDVGSRFILPNTIPKGSKIVSATFLLYALVGQFEGGATAVNNLVSSIPIRGDAGHQGNAPRYFDGDTVQVTPTTASATLQNSNVDKTPLYHDVTGIMQELVNAYDQQAVFLYTDATAMPLPAKTESEYFYSQAEDPNYTPRLTIVYIPSGVAGTVAANLGDLAVGSHGGARDAARVITTLGALSAHATARAALRATMSVRLGAATAGSRAGTVDTGSMAGMFEPIAASAVARIFIIATMGATLEPIVISAAAHFHALITVPASRIIRLAGVPRLISLTGVSRLITLKEAP